MIFLPEFSDADAMEFDLREGLEFGLGLEIGDGGFFCYRCINKGGSPNISHAEGEKISLYYFLKENIPKIKPSK